MCEKKFAKITFAESLQWPVCNCLLCNIKDSSHSVIPCFLNSKCGEFFCDKSLNRMCCCVCVSAVYIVFFFFLAIMHKLQSTEDSSAWLVVCIRSAENGHSYQQGAGNVYTYIAVCLRMWRIVLYLILINRCRQWGVSPASVNSCWVELSCELVMSCHIKHRGPVFLRHSVTISILMYGE